MKISLKWLSEYVDIEEYLTKPLELAALLTGAGLEAEDIQDLGAHFRHVVVGHILEKGQHPGADRLSLCQVTTGAGVVHQIVCGATNHKAGDNVVVALPGAVLPPQDGMPNGFAIKKSSIRGVESAGMLCSEKELGLKAESEGILILPPDAPVGTSFADYMGLNDTVFELKVTPNRADCLSHFGLAQEIACLLGKKAEFPIESIFEQGAELKSFFSIDVLETEMCPRYAGRYVRGVRVGPSPAWLRSRLEAVGLKSINNVVDITNFVMMELGQPLHAFSADKIRGNKIVVAKASPAEKFVTLDGTELTFSGEELTIRDAERALVLAGVIGGKDSGVSDSTQDLFIESAHFNPVSVRRASRKFGIETDSSYRFARGTNPESVPLALNRAVQLVLEICGGELAKGSIDIASEIKRPNAITITLEDLESRLGYKIEPADFENWMQRLGCSVRKLETSGDVSWVVTPPIFRRDIEGVVDLVEEHARLSGFDKIPEKAPALVNWPSAHDPHFLVAQKMRQQWQSLRYLEAIHYAFLSREWQSKVLGRLEAWHANGFSVDEKSVTLVNPLNEELGEMRRALAPSLLKCLIHNVHNGNRQGQVFELGFSHLGPNAEGQYREEARLGVLLWQDADAVDLWSQTNAPAVFRLKADVLDWLKQNQLNKVTFTNLTYDQCPEFLHPGQSAQIVVEGKAVGFIGSLHPSWQEEQKIRRPVAYAEINLEKLFVGKIRQPKVQSLSRFPAVERDLAFVMPSDLPSIHIENLIRKTAGELLQSLRVFDVYTGSPLQAGERSVAYRLVFQDRKATLEDAQINAVRDKIVQACSEKFAVRLRN